MKQSYTKQLRFFHLRSTIIDELVGSINNYCLSDVCRLIVRIRADAEDALVKLGAKFGCSVVEAVHLLKVAHDLGLNVVGVR